MASIVAHHDELLTQWRYIWMSKLGTNIFLISTTSNYLRSSAVCKNRSSKSWLFWFSRWNWHIISWAGLACSVFDRELALAVLYVCFHLLLLVPFSNCNILFSFSNWKIFFCPFFFLFRIRFFLLFYLIGISSFYSTCIFCFLLTYTSWVSKRSTILNLTVQNLISKTQWGWNFRSVCIKKRVSSQIHKPSGQFVTYMHAPCYFLIYRLIQIDCTIKLHPIKSDSTSRTQEFFSILTWNTKGGPPLGTMSLDHTVWCIAILHIIFWIINEKIFETRTRVWIHRFLEINPFFPLSFHPTYVSKKLLEEDLLQSWWN